MSTSLGRRHLRDCNSLLGFDDHEILWQAQDNLCLRPFPMCSPLHCTLSSVFSNASDLSQSYSQWSSPPHIICLLPLHVPSFSLFSSRNTLVSVWRMLGFSLWIIGIVSCKLHEFWGRFKMKIIVIENILMWLGEYTFESLIRNRNFHTKPTMKWCYKMWSVNEWYLGNWPWKAL